MLEIGLAQLLLADLLTYLRTRGIVDVCVLSRAVRYGERHCAENYSK